MHWQTAVRNSSEIDHTAAELLDTLERMRPLPAAAGDRRSVGRWLVEAGQDGAIADDTVVWLHHMLLPNAA